MPTFHAIRTRLAEELGDLCEAFYSAQERIEEGDLLDAVQGRFDSLRGNAGAGFETCGPGTVVKS